ncbi:hypothetical protein HYX07_00825 [Candidatus Woesearchaeota archaeon]|nr:hypothetical protein [Candidatus Woesearchaeota archaeon]
MVKVFNSLKGNTYFNLFATFVLILAIILLIFPYFNDKKSDKDILKLDLELENENLYNNQSLKFLTKLESNKKCDGLLQYEVFRLTNITLAINKTESIKFNGKVSRDAAFSLNQLLPNDYILRAKIKCNDNLGISAARFKIIGNETGAGDISDKLIAKQNISNDKLSEIMSIENMAEISTSEIIALSSHDPDKAEQMCNSLSTEKKDECISGIAERTKNKDFCSKIQSISARDGCYLSLVLEGIQIDCADVYDSYQRGACYSLKTNQGQLS